MSRVVTYCRVSSDEQALKDLSIPAQRKAMRRWVIDQGEDLEIVGEFLDEGQSAYAPADKRPGFREMIAFCRRSDIQQILVHKLDRFSRNREESILFKSLLRKHGVAVRSITEHFDGDTPQGFLYEGMIEVINQFYSMNLATETLKGMKENAERGSFNGGRPPYGYDVEPLDEGSRGERRLKLGPDEHVETVREVFRLATEEGYGCRRIVNWLNGKGIPGPVGPNWTLSTIGSILKNPVYMGDKVWNKRGTNRGQRALNSPEDWIIVRDAHPAIIPREVFEKRNAIASKRGFKKKTNKDGAAKYLLSRMIRCGHCGANFVGRKHRYKNRRGEEKTRYTYYCQGYLTKGPTVCPSLSIKRDWAEGQVLELIRERLCSPKSLEALKEQVKAHIAESQRAFGKAPQSLQRQVSECDRRIENYFRAIGDGVDAVACQGHIERQKEKKSALLRELEVIEEQGYFAVALENNLKQLESFADHFSERFEDIPVHTQRQILQHFVESIEVVNRERFQITLKVPVDSGRVKLLGESIFSLETAEARDEWAKPSLTSAIKNVQSAPVGGAI